MAVIRYRPRSRPLSKVERTHAMYKSAMVRMYLLVGLGIIVMGIGILIGNALDSRELVSELGYIMPKRLWWFFEAAFNFDTAYDRGFYMLLMVLIIILCIAKSTIRIDDVGIGMSAVLYIVFASLMGLWLSTWIWSNAGTIFLMLIFVAILLVGISAISAITKKGLSSLFWMVCIGIVGSVFIILAHQFVIGADWRFQVANVVVLALVLFRIIIESRHMKVLAGTAVMLEQEITSTHISVLGSIGIYMNAFSLSHYFDSIALGNGFYYLSDDEYLPLEPEPLSTEGAGVCG